MHAPREKTGNQSPFMNKSIHEQDTESRNNGKKKIKK